MPPVSSLKVTPLTMVFVHPIVRLCNFPFLPFESSTVIVSLPKNPFADDPST
uniref:Uncharacterized protein n=1 Tax=Lotus japonicus TaxID=34305 RepID=I3SV04_LOTJA|nr:unknown [Lotus japonicus]